MKNPIFDSAGRLGGAMPHHSGFGQSASRGPSRGVRIDFRAFFLRAWSRARTIFLVTGVWIGSLTLSAQPFHLHLSPSPGEAGGSVLYYRAYWTPTNIFWPTNAWLDSQPFATIPVGTTNVVIPASVGSPSFLLVLAVGTNGVSSTNLNWSLYDTNALWPIVTNLYHPPAPPAGGLVITNN